MKKLVKFEEFLNEELHREGDFRIKEQEEEISFPVNKKLKPIQKKVDELNSLISKAVDNDGDAIPVIDNTSTLEMPVHYKPVTFENGVLTISDKDMYGKKGWTEEVYDLNIFLQDEDENWFVFDDAKSDLAFIIRMYKRAIKRAIKEGEMGDTSVVQEEEEMDRESIANQLGIDKSELEDSSSLGGLADDMITSDEDYEYALDEAENIFDDYLEQGGDEKIAGVLTMRIPFKDEGEGKFDRVKAIFDDLKRWLNEDYDSEEFAYMSDIDTMDIAFKQVISDKINKFTTNENIVVKFKDFE